METNNLDVIRQAVLFTKQNNLVYKKVYASGPAPYPYYAIKVISIDPSTVTDWKDMEQDKHYFVTTFLTDGSEGWNDWATILGKQGWKVLSATETRQKGTKKTTNIPEAEKYFYKKEFLETEVSMDRPRVRPFGFLENFAVPSGSGTTGFFGQWGTDRATLGLSNWSLQNRFMGTPSFDSTVGIATTTYTQGMTANSEGSFDRNYTATNASSNLIQKHFLGLSDKEKITIGWSGGNFEDWWEDSYASSAVIEEGDDPNVQNLAPQENPAAVATFNQEVPLKADYSTPAFRAFYFDKKREFDSNPDPKKGTFKMPLPTEDELTFYGLSLMTFYQLGLEPKLTSKEVDTGIISDLINKLMGQLKIRQNIDDINDAREKAKKDELERAQKSKKNVDTGAGILTNLFTRVKD